MEKDARKRGGSDGEPEGRGQLQGMRPAPGKVTLTSKLSPKPAPAVQRTGGTTSTAVTRHRSSSELTADPWIDAAHRGLAALPQVDESAPVQRDAAPVAIQMQPGAEGAGPNMADRHVLANLNFWKGTQAGNSYLVQPIAEADLHALYREALAKEVEHGPVQLGNGQIWHVQQATGKFFPVSGPGIVQLTQQEVSFLRILVQQTRSGTASPEAALQNLSRAMSGQGYRVSPHMEIALEVVGRQIGFTKAQFTKLLAPNAAVTKAFDPPQELKSAAQAKAGGRAFRVLKWGGRIFLVVAIAADAYEIYEAENKAKTITKKAGAWTGATVAGGAAAAEASPLLAGGPWDWAGYGAIVTGAGILGYIAGGEVTETIYEWTLE